jgi:hypothetical protein
MPILGIIASSRLSAAATAYESIATVTLGSSQATISFTSIPATYKHLQIRCMIKNTELASLILNFNGDTGANYSRHRIYGDGSSAASDGGGSQSFAVGGVTSTQFGSTIIDILDYTNTNKNTTIKGLSGFDNNGSGWVGLWSSAWYNTSAVSSMTLTLTSFEQYSSIALYGIKGA